ncbi:MAG: transglutaminase-like cysteine peptidase [Rhodoblastus sp.]
MVHDRIVHVGSAKIGAPTSVPYGWVEFCQRYAGECDTPISEPRDIALTPQAMREIVRINRWVNDNIASVTDTKHWGLIDQWDYPSDGKGDCEDYVLLKRRMLMEAGFPAQALLVTVVKARDGEGHAVLTLKTDHGDYTLDNLADDVKGWKRTGYRFVKRQSQHDPNTWVALEKPETAPAYVSR